MSRLLRWKLEVARRARADRDLPTRHATIRDFLLAAMLISLLLWGDAMVDWLTPGRIDRHIAHQVEVPPAPERSYMATRDEHPAGVWRRVCPDGENWIAQSCQ
jgi:hypothetical protein